MTEPASWWRWPASLTWSTLIAFAAAVTVLAGGIGAVAAVTLTAGPGSCNTERVASQALPAEVLVWLEPLDTETAQARFLARFGELTGAA